MAIEMDQLIGLSKQVFITDYLLNGLFPCQSDVVRLIRSKKREWKFNDKFEYRMLLANTNTGGSLNSQVFRESVGLIKPGNLEYGIYHATYGTVSDGFDVDMMVNLETKEKQAAFETDYAMRMHSLRNNVAALFKNFAINGRFGVVHQISAAIDTQTTAEYGSSTGFTYASRNPQPNVQAVAPDVSSNVRTPFTIRVPINVFNSNFKKGKYLIKTKKGASGATVEGNAPWGAADVTELYLVLDNQPNMLTLLPVGTTSSAWQDGEFLEVAGNREISQNSNAFESWSIGAITVSGGPWDSTATGVSYDKFTGTGSYTEGANAVTGAMEGLADLFPWYTDPTGTAGNRLGLNLPFRGQDNRLQYSTEQAGGFVLQEAGEHIIDTIMRGAFLTKATVPYAEIGIWMNPVTRVKLGYEEGNSVQVLRDNFTEGPIVYQRGVKTTDYQIGNQVIKEVVEDLNMPTDVIIIGPKNDMSYNCWDNSTFEIDKYIQETWGKQMPPKIQDLSIPNELLAKMDLSQRITFGSPTLRDGNKPTFAGGGFRHPKNVVPVAMHECGALYTEYPYTYTVVKLREPVVSLN